MPLRERLEELEQPPYGCDILDVDLLLRECGYTCHNDGRVTLYAHDGWHSLWTFPATKTSIPRGKLEEITVYVRKQLEREGKI